MALACMPAQADQDASQWRAAALARAIESASAVSDPYRRAEAFAAIARVQAGSDDPRAADQTIHRALAAARAVNEAEFRGWALHDVALAQIARDDLIGARETAGAIEAARPHGAAWAALAEIEVRGGDLTGAQAIATKIRDPGARSLVLRQVIAVLASRGEVQTARQLLTSLDDQFYEALARGDIAAAEARVGRIEQAHALAARAPRRHRGEVYGRIALTRLSSNDRSGALESARRITDAPDRALVHGRMAQMLAERGDRASAREWLASAVASLSGLETQDAAMTLAQLGQMQAAIADASSARGTLQRALAQAERLPPGEQRDDIYEVIATAYGRLSDAPSGDAPSHDASFSDFAAALESAMRIDDRFARALIVRDLVALQPDAGAARIAAQSADPLIAAAAWFGVLDAQLARSSESPPDKMVEAAHAASTKLDPSLQPAALAALAGVRSRGEDGAAFFVEALSAAAALEPQQRSTAYLRIVAAINDQLMFLGRPAAPARR